MSSPPFYQLDWCRAHANPTTGTFWLSFHSRNEDWLPRGAAPTLSVEATTKGGKALLPAGTKVALLKDRPDLHLSYVTTRKGGAEAVLHVHNDGAAAASIASLTYDGAPVKVGLDCRTFAPTASPTRSPSKGPLFDVQVIAHTHPKSSVDAGLVADHPLFRNEGSTTVSWGFKDMPNWLSANPSNGELDPGTDQSVTFTLDCTAG